MGYLDGFGVTLRKMLGVHTDTGRRVTGEYPEEVRPKPPRFHGRHVLNRYEDGMEKCIGCELCAGVCPARCIYVRGADNDPENPTSPGERYGYVYEINYLRCIHCDLCVEACPTEAITETKLFEFAFTNRKDAIYTKDELLVDDDGQPRRLPWEHWEGGFDPAADTSGWMRATSPSGDADFVGLVAWAGELGYGVRSPEGAADVQQPAVPVATDEEQAAASVDGHGHVPGTFDDDHGTVARRTHEQGAVDHDAVATEEPTSAGAADASARASLATRAPGQFDLHGDAAAGEEGTAPAASDEGVADEGATSAEPLADTAADDAAPDAPDTTDPADAESTPTTPEGPRRGVFDAPEVDDADTTDEGRGRRWRRGDRR